MFAKMGIFGKMSREDKKEKRRGKLPGYFNFCGTYGAIGY